MARWSPHAVLSLTGRQLALATALSAAGACAVTARGPPIELDIALARARLALCTDGGVESPRALVEALGPLEPCASPGPAARVRCYLAQPDTTVEVVRVQDEVRIRVAIPRLSDHVHLVRVRRRGLGLVVEVDSAN